MIYALDSDTLSYMLKNDKKVQEGFENTIAAEDSYSIPPIVYYEVTRGLTYIKANVKLKALQKLYDGSVKNNNMTMEMWNKSIELYAQLKAKGQLIGDGDIFIASFCIVNDYTLITNNTDHFKVIKELKIINLKR